MAECKFKHLQKLNKVTDDFIVTSDEELRAIDSVDTFKVPQVHHPVISNSIDDTIDYSKYSNEIEEFSEGWLEDFKYKRKGLKDNTYLDGLFLEPKNFKGVTYRGSGLTYEQIELLDKHISDGVLLESPTAISTSRDYSVATDFIKTGKRKPVMFTFKTSGYNIEDYSKYPDEREVLIGKGSLYQVLDRLDTNKITYVLLEEVDTEIADVIRESNINISKDILSLVGIGIGLNQIKGENDG